MDPLKEKALEHLTSIDKTHSALTVVRVRGWVVLSFFVFIALVIMGWGFFGRLPLVAHGKAILFDTKSTQQIRSPINGIVQSILVTGGSEIDYGQPLAVIGDVTLTAAAGGTVVWVAVSQGAEVTVNQPIMTIQGVPSVDGLKIYAFLPLNSGELVRVGMSAKCELDNVDSSRYGLLLGTVAEILPYPADGSEYYLQQIPSQRLRDYLLSGPTPYLLVVIQPLKDPNTVSGMAWTSKEGPPHIITPPRLGAIRVILEQEKPLTY